MCNLSTPFCFIFMSRHTFACASSPEARIKRYPASPDRWCALLETSWTLPVHCQPLLSKMVRRRFTESVVRGRWTGVPARTEPSTCAHFARGMTLQREAASRSLARAGKDAQTPRPRAVPWWQEEASRPPWPSASPVSSCSVPSRSQLAYWCAYWAVENTHSSIPAQRRAISLEDPLG